MIDSTLWLARWHMSITLRTCIHVIVWRILNSNKKWNFLLQICTHASIVALFSPQVNFFLLRVSYLDGCVRTLNVDHHFIRLFCDDLTSFPPDFGHMSAQTVFSALDYLNRWTRKKAHSFAVRTQMISTKSNRQSALTSKQMVIWFVRFIFSSPTRKS
jgi:hypothetical protein